MGWRASRLRTRLRKICSKMPSSEVLDKLTPDLNQKSFDNHEGIGFSISGGAKSSTMPASQILSRIESITKRYLSLPAKPFLARVSKSSSSFFKMSNKSNEDGGKCRGNENHNWSNCSCRNLKRQNRDGSSTNRGAHLLYELAKICLHAGQTKKNAKFCFSHLHCF